MTDMSNFGTQKQVGNLEKNVFIFVNVTVNFYSDFYFPGSIYMTHTLQGSALDVLPTEKFRIVSSLILTR